MKFLWVHISEELVDLLKELLLRLLRHLILLWWVNEVNLTVHTILDHMALEELLQSILALEVMGKEVDSQVFSRALNRSVILIHEGLYLLREEEDRLVTVIAQLVDTLTLDEILPIVEV